MLQILITGSHGLVGSALRADLHAAGHLTRHLDLRAPQGDGRGDVLDPHAIDAAVAGCDGIIHLAAVSRVLWGERDPALCRATNEGGTRNLLRAALSAPRRPWFIFASSREVYGEPDTLPVREHAPLRPVNVYGQTKITGERLIDDARAAGLSTAIVRLSNVYGSIHDHADRVVPAFTRRALAGEPLRVDGAEHTFDFTHIDDTARGMLAVTDALHAGERRLPPIHFLTGVPTTLGELAAAAIDLAASRSPIQHAAPRSYDVARFYGDPSRARALLGWQPRVPLRDGLTRLLTALRSSEAPR